MDDVVGWVCERVRIGWVREVKQNKKGLNYIFIVKLIVTTYISSLLATYSDKISFVADNDTDFYDFVFSDD